MLKSEKIFIKKPRGRIPNGKKWNPETGTWVDHQDTKILNIVDKDLPENKLKPENKETIIKNKNSETNDPLARNKLIIRELETLKQKEFANNDKIRVIAYTKAIKIIKDHYSEKQITCGDELKEYKGIGDKIAKKVNEIIETGVLKAAEEARNDDKIIAINDFSEIYGIGSVKSKKLVVDLNITTIDELKKRKDDIQENGRPLLDKNQQLGLKYYKPLLERIPRSEMLEYEKLLKNIGNSINKKYSGTKIDIVGSFRRNEPDSGDIDILITNQKDQKQVFDLFIKKLIDQNYIIDTLGYGKKKFFGVSRLSQQNKERRIDIMYTTPSEFPFAQLYFTGSGSFNTSFREYANSKGYRLNEYKLQHYDPAKIPKLSDVDDYEFVNEKDIFDFFKIPYIEPQNRNSFRLRQELDKIE